MSALELLWEIDDIEQLYLNSFVEVEGIKIN
jgi:hypothetical protein